MASEVKPRNFDTLEILKKKEQFRFSVEISEDNKDGIPRCTIKCRSDDGEEVFAESMAIWTRIHKELKNETTG